MYVQEIEKVPVNPFSQPFTLHIFNIIIIDENMNSKLEPLYKTLIFPLLDWHLSENLEI